ncbi:hypothetical protein CF319_g8608 [Tilletia indica]|nr:hypothetical protein CF319_g8608 [Tilletia indica]
MCETSTRLTRTLASVSSVLPPEAITKLSNQVDENATISDIRFETFGCGSQCVKGMDFGHPAHTNIEIEKQLCLPPVQPRCSMLAEDVINAVAPFFVPCTAADAIKLLEPVGPTTDLTEKHAIVPGRPDIVGSPETSLLRARNATITQCHSEASHEDLFANLAQTRVIDVAIGQPHLIKGEGNFNVFKAPTYGYPQATSPRHTGWHHQSARRRQCRRACLRVFSSLVHCAALR